MVEFKQWNSALKSEKVQFHQSVGGKTEINMRRVGSNFELICLKTNDRFVNVKPNQKIMLIIFPSYERTSCTLNLSKWRMRSETKKIEKNKSWFLYYTCPFRYQYNAATYFLWQYFSISGTQWMKVCSDELFTTCASIKADYVYILFLHEHV